MNINKLNIVKSVAVKAVTVITAPTPLNQKPCIYVTSYSAP